MHNKWLKQMWGILLGILSALVAFLSYLPGDTSSTPRRRIKGVVDFVTNCPGANPRDAFAFLQAQAAHTNGDRTKARQLYRELLKKYPGNQVITHNLEDL